MSLVAQRMIIRFTLFEGTKPTGLLHRSRLQLGMKHQQETSKDILSAMTRDKCNTSKHRSSSEAIEHGGITNDEIRWKVNISRRRMVSIIRKELKFSKIMATEESVRRRRFQQQRRRRVIRARLASHPSLHFLRNWNEKVGNPAAKTEEHRKISRLFFSKHYTEI